MTSGLITFFRQQADRIEGQFIESGAAKAANKLPFFDVIAEKLALSQLLKRQLYTAIKEGAAYTMRQLGGDQSALLIRDRLMEIWAERQGLRDATEITATTEQAIRGVYVSGIEAGLGPNQIAANLRAAMGPLTGETIEPWRMRAIARTETSKASTGGQLVAYAADGVQRKFWITSMDEVVRDSHVDAGARYDEAGAIPVDEEFILEGGSGMGPGLISSAAESINCRCVLGWVYDSSIDQNSNLNPPVV